MNPRRTIVVALTGAMLVILSASGCRKHKTPPASAPTSAPQSEPTATAPSAEAIPPLAQAAPADFPGLMEWNEGDITDDEDRQDEEDELAALKDQADALTQNGQYEQAAEVYQQIVAKDPADRTSRFNLAVALGRLRRFSQAEEIYVRLLVEQPDFVQARYNLASLYQVEGKLAQACQEWQEVVQQVPKLASAHAALGAVLLDLGHGQEAVDAYAEASKLDDANPAIWRGLALASRVAGKLGSAAAAARKATQLDPKDAATWKLLGDALLELHRASTEERLLLEAAHAWRRSLELDPNQPDLRRIVDTIDPTTQKAP
jgi:tetratricopeptide (TPR) repeat protein